MLWVIRSCLNDKNTTVIARLLLCCSKSCLLLTCRHQLLDLVPSSRRLRCGIDLAYPLVRKAHRFHNRLMYQSCRGSPVLRGSLLGSGHLLLFLVELLAFEQFEDAGEQAHFNLLEAQRVHFRLV